MVHHICKRFKRVDLNLNLEFEILREIPILLKKKNTTPFHILNNMSNTWYPKKRWKLWLQYGIRKRLATPSEQRVLSEKAQESQSILYNEQEVWGVQLKPAEASLLVAMASVCAVRSNSVWVCVYVQFSKKETFNGSWKVINGLQN